MNSQKRKKRLYAAIIARACDLYDYYPTKIGSLSAYLGIRIALENAHRTQKRIGLKLIED